MKRKKIIALALAAVLTTSAVAATALAANTDSQQTTVTDEARPRGHGKGHRVAEPENAVGKDAAKEAALNDAGTTADEAGKVKARVTKNEDGTVVYKVGFKLNDNWYSYQIDALTGEILDKTEMTAEEHEAMKPQRPAGQSGKMRGKNKGGTADTDNAAVTADIVSA